MVLDQNFLVSWQVVKSDVMDTIKEFFENCNLDARLNRTLITLIPKHDKAYTIRDFRPISCCTTVYKVISKIMAN